jgi:hypothetical protein
LGKAELEFAIKVYGAYNVTFGGNYRIKREWLIKGMEDIRSLDISEEA